MQLTKILTIAILTAFYDKLNADESKRTYIVPSTWQGRTDWGRAELISEKDSEVVVKLTDDPTGQPRMFSKHDIAVGEVLKDRDAMIGMEVLAHVGHDLSKKPFYAKGTITSRVRPSQFTVQPSCAEKLMPIGVGVKLPPSRLKPIPDEQFKASSEYPGLPARNGRLGNGKAWCPARKKMRNAWLQIDLGAPYYLCSVVAQGETVKMSEWVEAFTIAVSNDGMTFSSLKDENGNVKIFQSSRDGTESILGLKLPYRYVRFFPGAYHNYPCLSVELYGVGPTRSTKSSQEFKADELFAVGDPLAPYLLVPSTWKDRVDWKLARLISHRGSDVYVKIPMVAGPPVRFSSTEVLLNVPPKSDLPVGVPVFAPFAKDKNNVVMYSEGRVTLNQGGKYFVSPFCSSLKKSLPLGVPIQSTLPVERVTSLPDSKLSATSESSSSHPAKNGRLGNTLVWCAAEGSFSSSSFTVDLGGLYHVCSVAVQGNLHDKNEFVTSFKIAMSTDGRRWTVIQDRQRNQLFKRNGKEPVEVHLAAQDSYRYVTFTPVEHNNWPCMGVELYGVGPVTSSSSIFSRHQLRMRGDICQLDHKCPSNTQCIVGDAPGIYSCQCPDGFMSSADGGDSIRPGTEDHCRTINPTGKVISLAVAPMPMGLRSTAHAPYTDWSKVILIIVTIVTFFIS